MRELTRIERDSCTSIILGNKNEELSKLNSEHPGWREALDERKKKVALGKLGVAKEVMEIEKLEARIKKLSDERDLIQEAISRKMPYEKGRHRHSCPSKMSLCGAIDSVSEQIEDVELRKNTAGKRYLEIQKRYRKKMADLVLCVNRENVETKGVLTPHS